MLSDAVASLLLLAADFILLSVVLAAIVAAVVLALRLQARVYLRGLQNYLQGVRQEHYSSRGLLARSSTLRRRARREAEEILFGPPSYAARQMPRWFVPIGAHLGDALSNPRLFGNLSGDERKELALGFTRLAPALRRAWSVALYTVSTALGVILATVWPFDVFSALSPGEYLLFGPLKFPANVCLGTDGFGLQCGAGLLVTAIICSTLCSAMLERYAYRGYEDVEPKPPDVDTSIVRAGPSDRKGDRVKIGQDKKPVRIISLSGGGFDTIMQLGVAHALVVLGGRVPDAIVGVSAGALHAAAIADVLQAGRDLESTDSDGQKLAQISRLREFVQAAHLAPERLFDAVLPDVYQVDIRGSLEPLSAPRFSRTERGLRKRAIIARSGLTDLYNEILSIPFSVGTLTRVLRRVLGLRAACSAPKLFWRIPLCAVEWLRLWVLLGMNLQGVSRLLPILDRVACAPPDPEKGRKTASAGELISELGIFRRGRRACSRAIYLAGTVIIWVSLTPLVIPIAVLLPFWLLILRALNASERRKAAANTACVDALLGMFYVLLIFVPSFVLPVVAGEYYAGRPHSPWQILAVTYALAAAVLVFVSSAVIRIWQNPRSFVDQVLALYSLDRSILEPHGIRTLLVELFDKPYYGRKSMDQVVAEALDADHNKQPKEESPAPRLIEWFASEAQRDPIHVGIAVGNTQTGEMDMVSQDTPLVNALLGAVSYSPWLPAQRLRCGSGTNKGKEVLYVDGASIARDPTDALFTMLHENLNDSREVLIYSVAPFPTEENKRRTNDELFIDLVKIVWKALRLKRRRDATMQRKLTELVTRAIPTIAINGTNAQEGSKRAFAGCIPARVIRIEPDYDIELNRRVLLADRERRHSVIEEAIADGCRATLEVMAPLPHEQAKSGQAFMKCAGVIPARLTSQGKNGSTIDSPGPGLPEICRRCAIRERPTEPGDMTAQAVAMLRIGSPRATAAPWPRDFGSENANAVRQVASPSGLNSNSDGDPNKNSDNANKNSDNHKGLERLRQKRGDQSPWPRDIEKNEINGERPTRPTVSFLFSGGVFRGVYQMGVINALNQLGLQPDIIAGASVGSVTGALIAEIFSRDKRKAKIDEKNTTNSKNRKQEVIDARNPRIVALAGVYLGIDRIILTDRFADSVRAFTIRAADADFSIRQLDRLLRRYDDPGFLQFDRNARRVIAGIERLFFINPYQLNELVRAIRNDRYREAGQAIYARIQQFLNRLEIGEEALGAEALVDLMNGYVTAVKGNWTIDKVRDDTGIQFIVTATNLSRNQLETLGKCPAESGDPLYVKGAILASSAFPGVFRPRFSWELFPKRGSQDRYIDGGVLDNLPLDAVVEFLDDAAKAGLIARRPPQPLKPSPEARSGATSNGQSSEQKRIPHLLVSASLEINARYHDFAYPQTELEASWTTRSQRVRELSYNVKLDAYCNAQRKLSSIAAESRGQKGSDFTPVDMHIVAIKPEWLCGTFAFHEMLGFKRIRQAKSIAHGCASTFLTFARLANPEESDKKEEARKDWLEEWGVIDLDKDLPKCTSWLTAFEQAEPKQKSLRKEGMCWLRSDRKCPFSAKALEEMLPNLPEEIRKISKEIAEIHVQCFNRDTHLREV